MLENLRRTYQYYNFRAYLNFYFNFHQMQNSLYKLFEHKCVSEVCVHIHPIMIKFLFKSPFSNESILRFLSEWRSSVQTAPTIVDW